jgi:hypothetical protein
LCAFYEIAAKSVRAKHHLHLLGKEIEDILLKERVSDLFKRLKLELGAEMVENRIFVRGIFALLTER